MLAKYKIHDIAKDLGVSSKEIIEILKNILGVERRRMTALAEHEINVVFEYYTQKFALENFNSYFSERNLQNVNQKATEKNFEKILEVYKNKVKKTEETKEEKEKNEEVVVYGEKNIEKQKVINTRVEDINTNEDKYNEKYDQIASVSKKQFSPQFKKPKFTKLFQKKKIIKKHETEFERLARINSERKSNSIKILIPEEITVSELSKRLKAKTSEVIKKLISLGYSETVNNVVDFDIASLVALDFHAKPEKEVIRDIEEIIINKSTDATEDLLIRPPVVVIMGHVDHGKTSLLDKIRNSSVTKAEQGGITQHIGAYKTKVKGRSITFLDTPGHEAFTAMRARGAKATDIAILVVAADDGIMPQTIEAINHAKDANVSIIVAINKIDKSGSNPEKIKQQLTEYGVICEEWGGDVPCILVSAKDGTGINNLLEIIVLVADLKELKANPNRSASGIVIEARLDKGKGTVATVLITNGGLKKGDSIIAGTSIGRIRSMTDYKGKNVKVALPSDPIEITGLDSTPTCGDKFDVVSDEKLARQLADQRKSASNTRRFGTADKVSLENLFEQMRERTVKTLKIILKADVNGSVEAVRNSLEKISVEDVKIKVIHGAVGAINESDVMLASASLAAIIGFNVRPNDAASKNALAAGVEIKLYRVIYDCINEITESINGMLVSKFQEIIIGKAECRKIFKISGIGTIAGCYVIENKIVRGESVRIIRDGTVAAEDKIFSIRRYKDDVKEISQNYECGITLERFSDFKINDIFEVFKIVNL
ncbi:MAG: translation initiation factor IF-2 [Oscillospiraceae bacterium]|jgi:translation initiation factor IF-2|nr:translation initiation factor IF-2 [Oscillospiraceae bacterium]